MRFLRRTVSSIIILMSMYVFSVSPLYCSIRAISENRREQGRMENVLIGDVSFDELSAGNMSIEPLRAAMSFSAAVSEQESEAPAEPESIAAGNIVPTTIEGGLSVKNMTSYPVNLGQLIKNGTDIRLKPERMQILIIHTHSSEAYTPSGFDLYEASDVSRTEDTKFNIVRVGDELTDILRKAGLNVIHDRGIYDYPSYTGSYTRSGQAVENYLAQYPDIQIVIDIHRDSLGENGVIYKTMAEEVGVMSSQAMLLVGTDESGLEHDNWQRNLALAMYLQNAVSGAHPTLMRPVMLVPQRYNQNLAPGSLILEVGSDGNTLQEALNAVRLFGMSAAPALAALVEQPQ